MAYANIELRRERDRQRARENEYRRLKQRQGNRELTEFAAQVLLQELSRNNCSRVRIESLQRMCEEQGQRRLLYRIVLDHLSAGFGS